MSRCFFCLLHFHELYKISLHSNMVNMREHPSNLSGLISQFSDESKFIPRTALRPLLSLIFMDRFSGFAENNQSEAGEEKMIFRRHCAKKHLEEIQMFLFFGLPLVLSL